MSKGNRKARFIEVLIPPANGGVVALCAVCRGVTLRAREALDLSACPACGSTRWVTAQLPRFDYARLLDELRSGNREEPAWMQKPVLDPWRGLQ